jgi:integrase
MNFNEQSAVMVARLATRKRNPAKPATLRTYTSLLTKLILPRIGHIGLESFNNGALKAFVESLDGLSPATIVSAATLVKQVIASAVSSDGDPLYPRQWNAEFIDLPTVTNQRQPTVSLEQLTAALGNRHKILWALLAGTGLRIGEAQALRFGDDGMHTAWIDERAVITVRTAFYRGQEQPYPKTLAGVREVDLTPELNHYLRGLLFPYAQGSFMFPQAQSTLRESLSGLGIPGFHSFRRFRATHLRICGAPEDLIKYWLGHAQVDVTNKCYVKSNENLAYRRQWAEKIGLGFQLEREASA